MPRIKSKGPTRLVNLKAEINKIVDKYPTISRIFLFGSRFYQTNSIRSDIDLLIETKDDSTPYQIGIFARALEPYIDIFHITGHNAVSTENMSEIRANSKEDLIEKLEAKEIWNNELKWIGKKDLLKMEVLVDYIPAHSRAAIDGFWDPASYKVDYLIITALDEEFEAIKKQLRKIVPMGADTKIAPHLYGEIKTQISLKKIALCKLNRPGPLSAALLTQQAILTVNPDLVILAGIAGGVGSNVRLGDIIIPERIVDYESVKIEKTKEKNNSPKIPTHALTRQKISIWPNKNDWIKEINNTLPSEKLQKHGIKILSDDVAMASGNKVVASKKFSEKIIKFDRKIAAIEMESLGVALACSNQQLNTPFIVIKGVSDFSNAQKNDEMHGFCCESTANLVYTLIKEDVI